MKKQLTERLKSAGVLSLTFALALSVAWATTYSDGVTIPRGKNSHSSFTLIKDSGQNTVKIFIQKYTLEPYMNEQGVDEVTVTADVAVEHVTGQGSSYYSLDFTFGPCGAFFEPQPLEVKLKGQYASDCTEVWMYDENGEAVEGERKDNADHTVFYIPHFSSYIYDHYDY